MLRKLRKNRGFTLIELMIVVAIVGILAILAIFGVRKYLANAKTAEATNTIGAINQNSIAAYERENATAEFVTGTTGAGTTHALCLTATNVPAAVAAIRNKKYVANTTPNNDYQTGSQTVGWRCLKFEMNQPQYYRYTYRSPGVQNPLAAAPAPPALPAALAAASGWTAQAQGDLNGDTIDSSFMTGGAIANGQPIPITQIQVSNPEE